MNMLTPTPSKERIQALDFLRGIAILGILIMNIQSFSMPGAAYINPTAYGDLTGANKWVWILSHIFADQKFMTIFSILYGAGIVLVTERVEARSESAVGVHYRRTFWLLIIGLIHAHIIWSGDILVAYALCALFAYFFRKWRPKTLMIIGTVLISVHTLLYVFIGTTISYWPPESMAEVQSAWVPGKTEIQEEIAALTGTWPEQVAHNSNSAFFMETFLFLFIFLWRAGGLMLVGMAFYKWGILTAKRDRRFYTKGLISGMIIGLPIIIYGIYQNFKLDWPMEYSMYFGSQFNYWGSLFVSFAYICGIMLIAKSSALPWLRDRLAAVGQMALTNYIAQSVISTLIFYGIGFGLLGQLERTSQVGVIMAVWLVIILWSKPWFNRFRFGPLEWLWRSLTYWQKQPFRR